MGLQARTRHRRKAIRMTDPINPDYYKTAPENSAIHGECIDYATDLGFVLGSAFKYVWRAGRKGDIRQDLNKAVKLLDHAIHNGSFRGQTHLRMDLATPQTPRRRIMLLIAAANTASARNAAQLIRAALDNPALLDTIDQPTNLR